MYCFKPSRLWLLLSDRRGKDLPLVMPYSHSITPEPRKLPTLLQFLREPEDVAVSLTVGMCRLLARGGDRSSTSNFPLPACRTADGPILAYAIGLQSLCLRWQG